MGGIGVTVGGGALLVGTGVVVGEMGGEVGAGLGVGTGGVNCAWHTRPAVTFTHGTLGMTSF